MKEAKPHNATPVNTSKPKTVSTFEEELTRIHENENLTKGGL